MLQCNQQTSTFECIVVAILMLACNAAVICANSCVLRDFSVVFWVLICASSPHCYPVQVITNCCTAKQISAICQALQLPECIPVMQCNVLLVYRARVLFARALVCDFKSLQFAPICNNAKWHIALQCNAVPCRVGHFTAMQRSTESAVYPTTNVQRKRFKHYWS